MDQSAPLLLYGYGAYGSHVPASFSAARLSLVDRGFVYAIAHVRGGTDKGWHWYTDGKLTKKQNTFTDFISAARHLIAAGYTRAGRIVAQGGSAGGMLMGAAVNLAPELFAGIIADVPFVDVLNTMLDASLPLTPPEWLEWGNPIADPSVFAVDALLFALRQCRSQTLPGDSGAWRPHRSARDLLGAPEMGDETSRHDDGRTVQSCSRPTWARDMAARRDGSTIWRKWRCNTPLPSAASKAEFGSGG